MRWSQVKILIAVAALSTLSACSHVPHERFAGIMERVRANLTITRIPTESCEGEGLPADARCGTLPVYENRESRRGRVINLHVTVLPSASMAPAKEALFVLAGGPGVPGSQLAHFASFTFARLRRDHEIVLLDLRGSGKSNPLSCRMYGDASSYLGDLYPAQAVERCLHSLEERADLRFYGTADMVADIEEVRVAMGYERVNIFATGFGTRLALDYARHHPEQVRSMILHAAVPGRYPSTLGMAPETERAIGLLFADCEEDASCAQAYPDLRTKFAEVLARFERGDVRASFGTGVGPQMAVARGTFTTAVASMLQSPATAARLPAIIHQTWLGQMGAFFETSVALRRGSDEAVSWGLFFAVACSEDIAAIDTARTRRDAQATFVSDYRLDQQLAACAGWPRVTRPVQPKVEPTWQHVNAPTLLIAGMLDPTANETWAAEVARSLPNSRVITYRNAAHTLSTVDGCADEYMSAFVVRADTVVDASCVTRMARPAWASR